LSGCFGDGGSSNAYDGTWTAVFVDSSVTLPPAAASGGSVACTLPLTLPTITLVNGIGSTSQTDPCFNSVVSGLYYDISVAVTPSTGAVSAIVNGVPLSGQCISTHGCAANTATASLSLTR
jgi:hypothetical protein